MDIALVSETENAKKWIRQFDEYDKPTAKAFLNSIKYVSHQEFEKNMHEKLYELTNNENQRIAVYPIQITQNQSQLYSMFTGEDNTNLDDTSKPRPKRYQYGSENRVGHMLTNFSRKYQKSNGISVIEVEPTMTMLFTQKINKIILIDDISGSGTRIINFYKYELPKVLKRYLSLGIFKLHVLTYVTTDSGYQNIIKNINYFKNRKHNLHSVLPNSSIQINDEKFVTLCNKYYQRHFENKGLALGYKKSFSKIIFAHGCPNNAPAILHQSTKGKNGWKALFPNRSTIDLQNFNEDYLGDIPEILWDLNQNSLALAFLENHRINQMTKEQKIYITILGLIEKKVKNPETYIFIRPTEFNNVLRTLESANFITNMNEELIVTELGKFILNKFKKINSKRLVEKSNANYYPSSCGGYSRLGN